MNQFEEYVEHGWKLCSIDRGRKAPVYDNWNDPAKLEETSAAAAGLDGAGLAHAASGTCALDIDAMELARPWLAERGVDMDALLAAPDAVRVESGRQGRSKLLYRLTRPMRTLKPTGSGVELRCATVAGKSVQDVLPPTIHPDTRLPYRWAYGEPLMGHWSALPPIPASLLALWRQLIAEMPAGTDPQTASPKEPIAVTRLRNWIRSKDPDMEYDDWVKVGMKLNDATGGAQEAFDLWDEWSKGGTRQTAKGAPVYAGRDVLLTHWHSFHSTPGKVVASLQHELPAEAEEFPVVDETAAPDEETTEQLVEQSNQQKRKDAREALEKRLVFVYSAERYFDCERHRIIGSDSTIEHMFTHMMPRNKGGRVSPVKMLKESGTKRYVDSLGFHPGESVIFQDKYTGDSYANTYRNRLPKPLEPTADELERIEWIFNRIDDPDFRDWLLMFYGHVIQRPGVKIKSAPLIWSDTQGNGKTTLVRMIPALLVGFQYSREVNCGLLNSDFNDYLLNAWHISLTEFRAGSRGERDAISKKVENYIADDAVAIHPKGLPGYTMPNHFFVTGSSNAEDAASITNSDRKWAIHEMHAKQFTEAEQEYLYTDFLLTPRAAGVLRHYFLNVDISGFHASAKAPETAARQEMVVASVSADIETMQLAFEERADVFGRDVVITKEAADYIRRNSQFKPSVTRIGRLLTRPPFNGKAIQFRMGDASYRAVVLRNHSQWVGVPGREIMAHINGEDVDISA